MRSIIVLTEAHAAKIDRPLLGNKSVYDDIMYRM